MLITRNLSALPTSVKNRYWLAAKIVMYAGTAFGIPFYAVHFHLYVVTI